MNRACTSEPHSASAKIRVSGWNKCCWQLARWREVQGRLLISRPEISAERFRKLALPEEDRWLVVIVTRLWIPSGGVRDDGKLAQGQSLRGSKSATCRFAGNRRVRFEMPAFTG